MTSYPIVSADSHLCEPPDLWTSRLDHEYRDRAPRMITEYQGRKGLFFAYGDAFKPIPAPGMFGAGKTAEELIEHAKKGFEAAPASVWDPAARLKEQDIDGVSGEVLYTSFGMFLYDLDIDLRAACFRVYNDFVAEYVRYDRKRLAGLALIDLEDIAAGVKEMERCAKMGLRGAMIWASAPESRPYAAADYYPFWTAAQELGLPLSLHALTGRSGPRLDFTKILTSFVEQPHIMQMTLASLIFGEVFERFPRLQLVSAENDVTWLDHFMYRADHSYERFRYREPVKLSMLPSEYIRRQLHVCFQFEELGMDLIHRLGAENIMWSSDYPHSDSTWPRSREFIQGITKAIPADATRKIVSTNAARLYGLEGSAGHGRR